MQSNALSQSNYEWHGFVFAAILFCGFQMFSVFHFLFHLLLLYIDKLHAIFFLKCSGNIFFQNEIEQKRREYTQQ